MDPELMKDPNVQKLIEQGHEVEPYTLPEGVDAIAHPRAWRLMPELMKYLPAFVKAVRAERYPEKPKEKKGGKKRESDHD